MYNMPITSVFTLVCCRSQIAYNVNVDPEAQEKIQKRAERFKSSLMPQRSTANSILNTIHSLVRIATFKSLIFTPVPLPSVLCHPVNVSYKQRT